MKLKVFIIMLMCGILYAQDMSSNSFASLFSDQKANRLGDAITVLVVESSQASNNSETTAGRESDIGLSGSFSPGSGTTTSIDGKIGTNNEFKGSGSTRTTGIVRTKISATVDSILANGNLHISGSRKIVINGEEQIVQIKGIVRNSDIRPDNSVMSYNIAEAEIIFEGNGLIDDSQSPGWLTKLFHWLF